MGFVGYTGKKSSVGRYELIEQLGEGGMGVVWRALDSKTGGEVAIKIMKDISDEASLDLFRKEWRTLAGLSHPNIVDVRDVDELVEDNERKPYFVMPLLRGATLSNLIRDSGARLTVSRVVEITDQVCRGLQAAHQRGLIHRDLKPSNIFVMDDDTAKIIDFGVVYLAGSHSVTGQKGTFQYMSPEQVQMKEVTPASDIFSLGVILYETLTARKPFACLTADDTMQAILKRTPPPVSELNPAIPHGISQVVHKCLAKQPINRFSSARELAATLKKAYRNEPIFDTSKLQLRIERAKAAFKSGDEAFASELLQELESEGHLDPEITVLRVQIDMAAKQKKVRHLLESARARIEQDEIPLGLDKLRELFELDPENADALALKATTEKRRSEAQAGAWIELANTHLANCDFTAARHAVQEALASRPGDPRAIDLRRRIDTVELEAKRVREQKEQLYNTAVKAYQNGEIDSALSRMVRLFSVIRSRAEGAVPERDAVYENFYKEIRSEHESIRSQLDEAQRQFGEEKFAQALAICAEQLAKYPNNSAFQTLKIQIEDAERQKISSYIATVSRNVDAEPDLDRRVNILREACDRYPQETQFAQQLKVVRERRDLVNAIVAKAHQFSERGQYNEELGQWDMLRNIHPRYPGLAFELEQCRKKRDLQVRNEEKAQLVEAIVGTMEAGDFEHALERTRLALADFPGDTELAGLEKLSQDGLERSKETSRLFEEGQSNASSGNWSTATELLQQALRLDPRHAAAKDLLIQVLTEQAHRLLDSDLDVAAHLHQQASELDSNHPAVRSVGLEIDEARHQAYVGQCLTEARGLVAVGNTGAAFERIREGRKRYPKDARLAQYETSLLKENQELQLRQERLKELARLDAAREHLERDPDSERARDVLRISRELSSRDPDSPDTLQGIAAAEQTVKRVMGTDDLSQLLRAEPENASEEKTRLSPPPQKPSAKPRVQRQGLEAWFRPGFEALHDPKKRRIAIGACSALVLATLGFALFRYLGRAPSNDIVKVPPPTTIRLAVTPADSLIKVDGVSQNGADVAIPADRTILVELSRLGYESRTVELNSKSGSQAIALTPLPIRVTITTEERNGYVELDGNKAGDLVDVSINGFDVPADGKSHTLVLTAAGRKLVDLEFQANPGQRPRVSPILNSANIRGMLVISSLGPGTTIYGGEQLKNTAIDNVRVNLSSSGLDVPAISDKSKELTYSDGSDVSTLSLTTTDRPTLDLRSLRADAEYVITSNVVSTAVLTANKKPVQRTVRGWRISQPGKYDLVLTAYKYEPMSWTITLKPRQSLTETRNLTPIPDTPVLSSLILSGGPPGARVDVDGSSVGELDASGSAQFAAILSPGKHQIQIRGEGFCPPQPSEITANPPAEVRIAAARLDACGSITAGEGAANHSTFKIRRSGDPNAKWIDLVPGKRTVLVIGTYNLHAEAPGFNPEDIQTRIEAGKDASWNPTLKAVPGCQLQNPSDVNPSGEWLKAKNSGSLVYLAPGCVNVNLVFAKHKGPSLFGKHMEWVLDAGSNGRIAYEINGDKLTRKAVAEKKTFDEYESDAQLNGAADGFHIRIRVEGRHVRISNDRGEVLDDYTPQNPALHDLASGRVGIKTSGDFKFSGGGL
jgi:serine/threonine-protein kinase